MSDINALPTGVNDRTGGGTLTPEQLAQLQQHAEQISKQEQGNYDWGGNIGNNHGKNPSNVNDRVGGGNPFNLMQWVTGHPNETIFIIVAIVAIFFHKPILKALK